MAKPKPVAMLRLMLSLLAFFLVLSVSANQFTDRWKEVERKNSKNQSVAFTDTVLIYSAGPNDFRLMRGGFSYKGEVNGKEIDFIYRKFTLISRSEEEMVLKDGDLQSTFRRERKKPVSDARPSTQSGSQGEPLKRIDKDLLDGEWKPYKRENKSGPSNQIDPNRIINSFAFDKNTESVLLDRQLKTERQYEVKFSAGTIDLVADGSESRKLTVYSLTDRELVLEDEDGIIYYMRRR